MRRSHVALIVLLLLAGRTFTQAEELLWHNFLTVPNGYDSNPPLSSEKNATVSMGGSWVADDADFSTFPTGVTVQRIRWAGALLENYVYTVEVIILNNDYSEVTTFAIPNYTAVPYDLEGGYRRYVAEVTLPDYDLGPNTYFFGVRLVSTGGRNFMARTGNGSIHGSSMGIFKSTYFGYPNWIPVNQILTYDPNDPYYDVTDFAFQVYGFPEPASLLLLGSGFYFLRRR